MNTATKHDLEDLTEILEALINRLPKLTTKDVVDVGARIRAVAKHADTIDKYAKELIKKKADGKAKKYVLGEVFKANVALVQSTRLDQTKVKVDYPDVAAECSVTSTDPRVTYEPR